MSATDDVRNRRKVIAAGITGNVLEWYDFAVYGFYAPIIGRLFFPSDDPTVSPDAGAVQLLVRADATVLLLSTPAGAEQGTRPTYSSSWPGLTRRRMRC